MVVVVILLLSELQPEDVAVILFVRTVVLLLPFPTITSTTFHDVARS
jgi:hypothetical protein